MQPWDIDTIGHVPTNQVTNYPQLIICGPTDLEHVFRKRTEGGSLLLGFKFNNQFYKV
jgi:hypothetical protein